MTSSPIGILGRVEVEAEVEAEVAVVVADRGWGASAMAPESPPTDAAPGQRER